eukprot:COSAG02_NODE_58586_length_277_cov_0.561798_1_plen_23_part_10
MEKQQMHGKVSGHPGAPGGRHLA